VHRLMRPRDERFPDRTSLGINQNAPIRCAIYPIARASTDRQCPVLFLRLRTARLASAARQTDLQLAFFTPVLLTAATDKPMQVIDGTVHELVGVGVGGE
jgi:hypothetical protein